MSTAVLGQEAGHSPDDVAIPDATLPELLLAAADRYRDRTALIDSSTGRRLAYGELGDAVREVGAGFAARGVRPGHVVALCAPNSIEFVLSWYAALSIGAVVTTVNPLSTDVDIVRQLERADARWLVSTAELLDSKARIAARAAGVVETFVIGAEAELGAGALAFDALATSGTGEFQRPQPAADDVAFLPSSSGTTGLPKNVVLTHRNLVANLAQTQLVHRVSQDDVVLAVLPLFHIFGLQVSLNVSLLHGATVVIQPRYALQEFLRVVHDHRVTRASVVPPIVLALANSELVDHYNVSSLRELTAGAAPLGADLARSCAQRLGCKVKQGYGMTETAGGTHIAPDDGPDRPDSIGPALPGVECRIVDPETEVDLGPGEPGELLIRSPSVMRGYLDNPDATAATLDADGWLHTGDIATVDADGWYRITDRIKELIKYKGNQVAPAELESMLLSHPAVADAAVVRSPDASAGEVPKAFVVLRAAAHAEDLMAWVAERVAPYKRVRRMEFIDEIPKSPSGKILRRLLVEREVAAHA